MRSQRSAPRRRIVAQLITAVIVVAATSAAFADIWTYQVVVAPGGGATFQKAGRIPAEGSNMAIVCSSQLGTCFTFDCTQCHLSGSGSDGDRAAAFDESRHWREYFPKRAISLPTGPPLAFGDLLVEQRSGRLIVLDRQRQPLFRLPTGAIVLGGRSRKPACLIWPGDHAPEALR